MGDGFLSDVTVLLMCVRWMAFVVLMGQHPCFESGMCLTTLYFVHTNDLMIEIVVGMKVSGYWIA